MATILIFKIKHSMRLDICMYVCIKHFGNRLFFFSLVYKKCSLEIDHIL